MYPLFDPGRIKILEGSRKQKHPRKGPNESQTLKLLFYQTTSIHLNLSAENDVKKLLSSLTGLSYFSISHFQ